MGKLEGSVELSQHLLHIINEKPVAQEAAAKKPEQQPEIKSMPDIQPPEERQPKEGVGEKT